MALLYSHSFTRTVIQSIPQPFTKLRFIVLVTFTFLSHFVSTFMNCSEICVSNVYFSPRIKTSLRYSSMVLAVGCDFLRAERESQAKQRRGKNSLKAGPHKKHPHFVGKGAQKAASRSLTVALTVVHSHSLPPPLIPGGCSGGVAACVRGSPQIPTKLGQNETIPRRQNRENWEEAGLTQNSTQQQPADHGRPFVLRH